MTDNRSTHRVGDRTMLMHQRIEKEVSDWMMGWWNDCFRSSWALHFHILLFFSFVTLFSSLACFQTNFDVPRNIIEWTDQHPWTIYQTSFEMLENTERKPWISTEWRIKCNCITVERSLTMLAHIFFACTHCGVYHYYYSFTIWIFKHTWRVCVCVRA